MLRLRQKARRPRPVHPLPLVVSPPAAPSPADVRTTFWYRAGDAVLGGVGHAAAWASVALLRAWVGGLWNNAVLSQPIFDAAYLLDYWLGPAALRQVSLAVDGGVSLSTPWYVLGGVGVGGGIWTGSREYFERNRGRPDDIHVNLGGGAGGPGFGVGVNLVSGPSMSVSPPFVGGGVDARGGYGVGAGIPNVGGFGLGYTAPTRKGRAARGAYIGFGTTPVHIDGQVPMPGQFHGMPRPVLGFGLHLGWSVTLYHPGLEPLVRRARPLALKGQELTARVGDWVRDEWMPVVAAAARPLPARAAVARPAAPAVPRSRRGRRRQRHRHREWSGGAAVTATRSAAAQAVAPVREPAPEPVHPPDPVRSALRRAGR